jgi:hypothetical protein
MMKRVIGMIWPLLAVALALLSCANANNGEEIPDGKEIPELYTGFHNYPTGRTDPNGLLTITNSANAKVLLFTDSVAGANYIGTVEGLSSVTVKLPEEKFYTIVAMDKTIYEEKGDQASQYSDLTYYSNVLAYAITVRPNDFMYGAGEWIIQNRTDYWVSMRKQDSSGANWAVVAPNTLRTVVPIPIGIPFDFTPHFFKELKHKGKVIAVVESDDIGQSDTVNTSENSRAFYTYLGEGQLLPSATLNPAIFLSNRSDKTIRVYSGQNVLLSPKGASDFAMSSGWDQMFTDILAGTNINTINFSVPGWEIPRVPVSGNMEMQKNKVYRIVFTGNIKEGYDTTVKEEDASEYFNN